MTFSELTVPLAAKGGIISIGNFDGVHLGHQAMLARVRRVASAAKAPAVIVTFDPHPIRILKPEVCLPRLSTISDRIRLLKSYGADEVVVLPTNERLLSMTPEDFFAEVIQQRFAAAGLVEGPDFRFGKDRSGDVQTLGTLCGASGLTLHVIEVVESNAEMISSTRIRRIVQNGSIAEANALLGHCYRLAGTVGTGAQRGRTIGFPTANLSAVEVQLPSNGVYAGRCEIDGQLYATAVSIGTNPTFGETLQKVECHLVGFSGDLYGRFIEVDLLQRIRDLRSFVGPDALADAIQHDVAKCLAVFRAESGG